VRSTLKQLCRDWSHEGTKERKQSYGPILDALTTLYSHLSFEERANIRVLNPGCGLGRLPWEIAKLGFRCEGNEFSYFMLLVSHYMLNQCPAANQHIIYLGLILLYIYNIYIYIYTTNVKTLADQFRGIKIPDVSPTDLVLTTKRYDLMSMVAGDFIEVYPSNQEYHDFFNCVVSCFFLDTAHNILEFLDAISLILKTDGYLVNIGPLLYHFEDMSDPSIELTWEEVKASLPHFGFELVQEKLTLPCVYTNNPNSMLQTSYDCVFFIAKKIKSSNGALSDYFLKPFFFKKKKNAFMNKWKWFPICDRAQGRVSKLKKKFPPLSAKGTSNT
ncbi:hypothetical protein RFI_21059, partial [Reticulomyxa filosa]